MTTATATCANCRFSRPPRGNREELAKWVTEAEWEVARMKARREIAKPWDIFAPDADAIMFAEERVNNRKRLLKQFDDGLICHRFPATVEKKRNDFLRRAFCGGANMTMIKLVKDDLGQRRGCLVEKADGGYDEEEARYVLTAPEGFVFRPHMTKTMTVYWLKNMRGDDPDKIGRRCLSDLELTAE